MNFFRYNKKIYPVIALLSGIFIIVFGLVMAKTIACTYFLLGVLVWMFIFGCGKSCLHIIPSFLVIGGLFFGISYAVTKDWTMAMGLANRLGAIFLAIVPGMGTEPVRMTRNLSQMHTPRSVTLGMLIARSFVPMLTEEERRVREAMKTRGTGSIFNPKILYRSFLVPLVMRLVNISDTLALSVETRGFALGKVSYTIYKKESIVLSDVIFVLGLVAGAVLAVVL